MCGTRKRTLGHKTRKDTRLKFYKSMALLYLMYDSDTCTLRRTDERRLEAAKMRFLRYVAGYKERQNKVTTRNGQVGQANTRKEEKFAGISTEDAIGKSSQATYILSADRKT
jgi:hypothetical protein